MNENYCTRKNSVSKNRKGGEVLHNHQLETFIQVADAGSFSKAAEILYISPNAVIKQINLLESSLELSLFVRTHKGISITPSGESLYRDAKYIIQYSKDSISRAKNIMYSGDNVIRIGTSLLTPTQFLMELWPQIHMHCPNLKFQLIPFENTPENAREIMRNFGQTIDLVAGIFDADLMVERKSDGMELSKEPICCAVSIHHKLAEKEKLTIEDLLGENLMMIQRGWNSHIDTLRDDIEKKHTEINIVEFPFYDVNVFNQCEQSNNILTVIERWENVHPLLKIIPLDWDYVVPFGLIFSPTPSDNVYDFIRAVAQVYGLEC